MTPEEHDARHVHMEAEYERLRERLLKAKTRLSGYGYEFTNPEPPVLQERSSMTRKRWMWSGIVSTLVVAVVLIVSLIVFGGNSGVSSTPPAMCAYVIGDGKDGHDNRIHKIIYQSQALDYSKSSEDLYYVPCNSRNYIINDGSVTNVNNDRVGDRFKGIVAYVAKGQRVIIYVSAYWTLNQNESAMRKFYELCYKYSCGSDSSAAGDVNYSTKGWNGLLSENFGPALDTVGQIAVSSYPDDIWYYHRADLIEQLGVDMSNLFNAKVRAKTGYDVDLFCGSGNSQWPDPNKPGVGEFTCTNVRIVVDGIYAY